MSWLAGGNLPLGKLPRGRKRFVSIRLAPSFPFGPDPIESCGYELFSPSSAQFFPPAVTISAGITRTGDTSQPPFFHALASFGVVYFDEISAYTTSGSRQLTSGDAITMVNQNGKILARPVRLNDFAFKTVFAAAL